MDDAYDIDELLGAYALDAVDDDERARVEEYLRVDPRAAEEVRRHREVATMLAFTGMDAPHGVWARIEDEIEGTAPAPGPELARVLAMGRAASDTTAVPTAQPERAGPTAGVGAAARPRRAPSTWLLGAAAAVAVVLAGVAVVASVDDDGSGDPIADAFESAEGADGSSRAELVAEGTDAVARGVVDDAGRGFLDARDLPELGTDQTYQLWGVIAANGDVVSLGILGNDPDLSTFTVDSEVAALAVTIEEAPGVISDGNPEGAFVGELS